MNDAIQKAVLALSDRASGGKVTADEAMKFAQAALNLANAGCLLVKKED